jgi:hypothetical protein
MNVNWYKLIYWITVAERVQTFILTVAISATIIFTIASLVYWYHKVSSVSSHYNTEENKTFAKWAGHIVKIFLPIAVIFWILEIAVPDKSDTVLILAGGAVGQFIQSDSASQKIPADISNFLHEKIGELTREAKGDILPSPAQTNLKNLEKLNSNELMDKIKNLPDSVLEKIK